MRQVDRRILELAGEQSRDIRAALERRGVRVIDGVARVVGPNEVSVRTLQDADAEPEVITSDAILVAVGALAIILALVMNKQRGETRHVEERRDI